MEWSHKLSHILCTKLIGSHKKMQNNHKSDGTHGSARREHGFIETSLMKPQLILHDISEK